MSKIDFLTGTILAMFDLEVILLLQSISTQIAKTVLEEKSNIAAITKTI